MYNKHTHTLTAQFQLLVGTIAALNLPSSNIKEVKHCSARQKESFAKMLLYALILNLELCKISLRTNSVFLCVQFHFNPAQSVLVVEGEDVDSINTAMTKVSYINSRQFPTPGLRRLHIITTVQ